MDHFLGAILILTSLIGGVGWWYTYRMASTVQSLQEENLQAAEYLTDAERGLWELRFALPNYLVQGSEGRAHIRGAAAGFMRRWGPTSTGGMLGGVLRARSHDGWDERAALIEAELLELAAAMAANGRADWRTRFPDAATP